MMTISRSQANRAGKILKTGKISDEYYDAISILDAWRKQHENPAKIFFKKLLEITNKYPNSIATYRLKRKESILNKLNRNNNHFKLGEIDDIVGCRVIVDSVDEVYKIYNEIIGLKQSGYIGIKTIKDYIKEPESSGYRSLHVIINQLCSYEEESRTYRIELQIRTRLQHYWSTAVEAMGEIDGVEYKNPTLSACDNTRRIKSCLKFFKLISELVIAREYKNSTSNKTIESINAELEKPDFREIIEDLTLVQESISIKIHGSFDISEKRLYLLEFSRETQELNVYSYTIDLTDEAIEDYNNSENNIRYKKKYGVNNDASQKKDKNQKDSSITNSITVNTKVRDINRVLVYAKNNEQLYDAYPNYSYAIGKFIDFVETR